VSQQPEEELLVKVLLLERKQGYRNRAAIGGLSGFARKLHESAGVPSRVPEAAILLSGYDIAQMSERRATAEQTLRLLQTHGETDPSSASNLTTHDARSGSGKPTPDAQSFVTSVASAPEVVEKHNEKPEGRVPHKRSAKRAARPSLSLESPIEAMQGVGTSVAATLTGVGVRRVRDLLYYFPREHYDYRRRDRIRALCYGEKTTILGVVQSVRTRFPRRGLSITTAMIGDDSGSIPVRWFNQSYLEKQFQPGRHIAISGQADLYEGYPVFLPRDYEWISEQDLVHSSRLVPVYPLSKGLYQKSLRKLIRAALDKVAGDVTDFLPSSLLKDFDLWPLNQALEQYHFPDDEDCLSSARRRLAFDEVFSIQIGLLLRKREWQRESNGHALPVDSQQREAFLSALPFTLTRAQTRVTAEVEQSIATAHPMSRLVQGDVGAGKTVIAAFALYAAKLSGFQGSLMAPTEILARQHAAALKAWLSPLGVSVQLLVGGTGLKDRRAILRAAAEGTTDVLVGTHTLFQEGIDFARLAIAVVDEQHRFGVAQRSRLRQKGISPHILAMTATPIPRTLALTLYGDLDVSLLDELPPGRKPVDTLWVETPPRAYTRIREEVEKGRQAFVICPVIEESKDLDLKSAIAEHRHLSTSVFPRMCVGLLHGRMKPADKERILDEFRAGDYDVLVATSVVEVGIDIPNATVMVIRDAHRFGLAQLHQLRGRTGRGADQSYCLLVSDVRDRGAHDRLMAVVQSQDGFRLAEEDLRLRGPGEFWGTRQSGIPELRVTSAADLSSIQMGREAATALLAGDPDLTSPEHAPAREHVNSFWSSEADLS
jgi:ATP-dependent DNA helicase RecG